MTATLRESYPGAADIVEVCESMVLWDTYRQCAAVMGMEAFRKEFKALCLEAAKCHNSARGKIISSAAEQFDHPDFDAYLLAKLGAM